MAQLTLRDYSGAVQHLEKGQRYRSMTTSRSSGAGSVDLIERARERKQREHKNPNLPTDVRELDRLMASVESYRGKVPVRVLSNAEYARLAEAHASISIGDAVVAYVEQAREQQQAVAEGRENPYERQVGRTASQGFYLFLMPFGNKLDAFPEEVTELTHLNQLRLPKHGFTVVPETIGRLTELEFLDLSGNNIESLPDSIANLTNLKTLKLKGNPLADGELERLKTLLPKKCKIKG